jgi:hypothetical protein
MEVPTSKVGYISATTGRGDHEVHKGHMVASKKPILDFKLPPCFECRTLSSGLFSVTEPYSLTHLPVASMWVIISTTCFLYLLPPLLPPPEELRLFFVTEPFSLTITHVLNRGHTSYPLTYEDGPD